MRSVEQALRTSKDMYAVASKGCEGCGFFLTVISQHWKSNPDNMEAFVQRDEAIWLGKFDTLRTIVDTHITVDLRLCRAKDGVEGEYYSVFPYSLPIPKDPSSQACFAMASAWLDTCSKTHPQCSAQVNVPLPTRLLKITDDASQHVQLYVTQPGEQGRYLTLSHCWGDGVKFVTNCSNLHGLEQAIEFTALPPTFQDAISITKRLGFQYLWIDALCIIQDSKEDWLRESSMMAAIYTNGTLMISATAATDGQSGILTPRSVLTSPIFDEENTFWQTPPDIDVSIPNYQKVSKPLHTRAWTYQERILAPRVLEYGPQRLEWSCATKQCFEDTGLEGYGGRYVAPEKVRISRFIESHLPRESLPPDPVLLSKEFRQRLNCYYDCVQEYSKRKLTFISDKFPAFSGLVSAIRTPELGAYIAGLWETDLVYGLDWQAGPENSDNLSRGATENGVQATEATYIGPSWSWVSMPGKVTINNFRKHTMEYPTHSSWEEAWDEWTRTFRPQLLSHHLELSSSDPHGRLLAASITLRGHCRSLALSQVGEDEKCLIESERKAWLDYRSEISYKWRFTGTSSSSSNLPGTQSHGPEDPQQVQNFTAFLVSLSHHAHETGGLSLVMLILDAVKGAVDTYRRIGCIRVSRDSDHGQEMRSGTWKLQDFTLI